MKYIIIIILLLFALMAKSQVYQEDTTKYMKNPTAYPSQLKGYWPTNIFRLPDTTNNRPQIGVPGAFGRNAAGTQSFIWDGSNWVVNSGGVTIDSVFISSIDSIFISNTDSIFIVSGNDTIFIGIDSSLSSRFGIEDNTGIQNRLMNLNEFNLDIVGGTPDFSGQTGEIYVAPDGAQLNAQTDPNIHSSVSVGANGTTISTTNDGGTTQSSVDQVADSMQLSSTNGSGSSILKLSPTRATLKYNGSPERYMPLTVNGHPADATGNIVDTIGGGGIQIDSVFITSIDSLFITTTDSIFIISGNDTIFIGMNGSGMDTAYQRGDSLFGVKNNIEFLVGLTGGAPTGVPGTKDTLWYNVKWFGALGDGVTDDRAAIQVANDYLSAIKGGYLWFPAGIYPVSDAVYRHSFVNWEGVKDSSIVRNTNPTHTQFGDQAVMWMGNYNPSAYDTTVGRFFRGHMGTIGNKMQIVDSISKFHVGDVVVIEGMTGWAGTGGDWKPYVVRINEIDSIYNDTVVFHYQVDTLLANARINISGHFISNGTDRNGHAKYLVRNVTTRNMVFESQGQWILGMASLGCRWDNIRIKAAELFTGNGMAWTTATNIYGQWWKQVSEFAIGCHNTVISGVNAHYINNPDTEQKPYIKFGENVHAVQMKDVFIDAGNFPGNGVWFGAATECIVDGIHSTGQQIKRTHIEFSDNDLGDAPASFVNNNVLRHGYFKNRDNLANYVLMTKSTSAGQLRNNVVNDVVFVGPVSDATSLVLDGYRPELKDLYTTEGEVTGGDSLYKGIISGGTIANIYDVHGNTSQIFFRSVFDTSGKNRSHFTDIIMKYVPDDSSSDGQFWYNQGGDALNFKHNGTITNLLAPFDSTFIQTLTPGFGLIGSPFDGTAPQTWAVDTTILNVTNGTDTAIFIVDSIANAPTGSETAGTKYLVGTAPTGTFATHANQVATFNGAVWSYQTPLSQQSLIVDNAITYATYQFSGTYPTGVWKQTSILARWGGNRAVGGNGWLGRFDKAPVTFRSWNKPVMILDTTRDVYLPKFIGTKSNNFIKIDSATGKLLTDSFVIQKVKDPIRISGDTIYMKASGVTPGSYTNLNATIDSNGIVTAASNGTGGAGSVTSFSAGTLSPLFTTSVATATTTPALTFALSNASAYTLFGRGASTGVPSFLASIDSNWIPSLHSEAYYNTKYITTTDGTPFALTMNNSGAGNASGSTFNGTVARTLSYNSIGAQAALSGTGYVSFSGTTPSYVATITPTTGGTGLTSYTTGDILYASATNVLSKLTIGGTTGQPLVVSSGGIPTWGTYIQQDSINIVANNLTTTVSNRLNLYNNTLATSGVTLQNSPAMLFRSHDWTGSADRITDWTIYGNNRSLVFSNGAAQLTLAPAQMTVNQTIVCAANISAGSNTMIANQFRGSGVSTGLGQSTIAGGNFTNVTTNATNTVPSGSSISVNFLIGEIYNQVGTGTGANYDLLIDRKETVLTSGAQILFDAGTNSGTVGNTATHTSKFSIDNTGATIVGSTLTTNGKRTAYVAKTGTYTITGTDETIETTSGTFTLTLPTAVGRAGQSYFITNSGSGTITLGTTSSQTFVNVTATPTTLTLAQFDSKIIISNGANWLAK